MSAATAYRLIPKEEGKCIWMLTGHVSFKLCANDYHCDRCLFYQAMTEATGLPDWEAAQALEWPQGEASARVDGSFFYHPGHCWVKVENSEEVKIGLDDFLAPLISDINVITLPPVGHLTKKGAPCAHIIRPDYIVPVISPVSGSIQKVNHRLKTEPELLANDPLGEGWLVTIKALNLEADLEDLMFGRKAVLWFRQKEKEIVHVVERMLKDDQQALGPTMQDGGVRITCLQDVLKLVNAGQRLKILDFFLGRAPALKGIPS